MWTGRNLYQVIEEIVRKEKGAVNAVELYDIPEVKEYAKSLTRVSDYLGNLWRRGKLLRSPLPKRIEGHSVRWQYSWNRKSEVNLSTVKTSYQPKHVQLEKSEYKVWERNGVVTIETKEFRIDIRPKQPGG